jgi:hypothetical protein
MATLSASTVYERQARRLISSAADRFDEVRTNPITGSRWLSGADPISEQIRTATRALMARDQFAAMAPPDAPPLPLSYDAREKLKVGGLPHIVAWFDRSIGSFKYDFGMHPTFEPYARGVLASPYAPDFITQDPKLQQRFPARQLKGLGPSLYWDPTVAPIRSALRWQQRLFLGNQPPHQSTGTHTVVDRQDANVDPSYAPSATAFLQLDDEFIAHATKLASCKRLPRGWEVHKPYEVFNRRMGGYMFWLVKSDYGWLIERQEWPDAVQVLAKIFFSFPILCDTPPAAARLAEAVHAGLNHHYQLTWIASKSH